MARSACAVAAVGTRLLATVALRSATGIILRIATTTSASASLLFQFNDVSVFLEQKERDPMVGDKGRPPWRQVVATASSPSADWPMKWRHWQPPRHMVFASDHTTATLLPPLRGSKSFFTTRRGFRSPLQGSLTHGYNPSPLARLCCRCRRPAEVAGIIVRDNFETQRKKAASIIAIDAARRARGVATASSPSADWPMKWRCERSPRCCDDNREAISVVP